MRIQKIDVQEVHAVDVPQILQDNNVPYQSITRLNWPHDYPYLPSTSFGIAHTENAILLHFIATERCLRAYVTEDLGDVWTDACVEFFISPKDDGRYYNIECNCLGKILFAVGEGRHNRVRATKDVVSQIDRWASLGGDCLGERAEDTAWQVALVIPYSVFFAHDIKSLTTIKANFYKCGGSGEFEHYVSFSPISTPAPDFHRPEFFAEISLD